jgi:hypothetical protein
LLGFQAKRRINESFLLQKWLKNVFDTEDDAYETPIFAYSIKLDLLVLAILLLKVMWKKRTPHHIQKMQ